jgi:hypothetical protein
VGNLSQEWDEKIVKKWNQLAMKTYLFWYNGERKEKIRIIYIKKPINKERYITIDYTKETHLMVRLYMAAKAPPG